MAAGSSFTPDQDNPDLVAHERTYKAFNILLRWCMTLLAAGISFLTLWFATSSGFVGSAVVGLVILFVGYGFLVRGEAHKPPSDFNPDH